MLKLMDECAGIVARKHCKTNVVTVSMDATNFHSPVTRGIATGHSLYVYVIMRQLSHWT